MFGRILPNGSACGGLNVKRQTLNVKIGHCRLLPGWRGRGDRTLTFPLEDSCGLAPGSRLSGLRAVWRRAFSHPPFPRRPTVSSVALQSCALVHPRSSGELRYAAAGGRRSRPSPNFKTGHYHRALRQRPGMLPVASCAKKLHVPRRQTPQSPTPIRALARHGPAGAGAVWQ